MQCFVLLSSKDQCSPPLPQVMPRHIIVVFFKKSKNSLTCHLFWCNKFPQLMKDQFLRGNNASGGRPFSFIENSFIFTSRFSSAFETFTSMSSLQFCIHSCKFRKCFSTFCPVEGLSKIPVALLTISSRVFKEVVVVKSPIVCMHRC